MKILKRNINDQMYTLKMILKLRFMYYEMQYIV